MIDNHSLIGIDIFFAASKVRSYRANITTMFRSLIDFLQDNGLTTKTILGKEDSIPDDLEIFESDLTLEGIEFYSIAVEDKWLRAIDRGTPVTDISILERELKKLRAESE